MSVARHFRAFLVALILFVPLAAQAIQPDEVLGNPVLEARARAITKELRCVVCQSESIDESNADIARDLRLMVRERIVAGDSDAQVLDYVVDRYGEFVLFRPPFWRNPTLWLAGPVMFLLGLGLAFAFVRRRAKAPAVVPVALSAEEQARVEEISRG